MKPMMIVPFGILSNENLKILRDNGICVVTAKDPSKIKFIDPLPVQSSRTEMEGAAIKLSRLLLNKQWSGPSTLGQDDFAKLYVECLVTGTPLDPRGSREEQEQRIIDYAREEELRKIGREEARAKKIKKEEPQQ